jgi:hypothetical protein
MKADRNMLAITSTKTSTALNGLVLLMARTKSSKKDGLNENTNLEKKVLLA